MAHPEILAKPASLCRGLAHAPVAKKVLYVSGEQTIALKNT
jgi:hypothetical protein